MLMGILWAHTGAAIGFGNTHVDVMDKMYMDLSLHGIRMAQYITCGST